MDYFYKVVPKFLKDLFPQLKKKNLIIIQFNWESLFDLFLSSNRTLKLSFSTQIGRLKSVENVLPVVNEIFQFAKKYVL